MTKVEEIEEKQVSLEMNEIKSRLSELQNGIFILKDRLGCILRNDSVDVGESTSKPESLVRLASDIRDNANTVIAMNIEINNILRELEL